MSTTQQSAAQGAESASYEPRTVRRAMLAGSLGTLIEYFDFSVYGYLAVVIAPQFFPSADPAASMLAALAVFATGLVVRPLGGVFFGWLGDRWGRRKALVSSVLCMGVASSITGLLPTYSQIGVTAAVLLLLTRLVQGISTGGESVGAYTYIYESAPPRRRAFLGAVTPIGSNLGFMLAAATAGVISAVTTKDQMADWGWRLPFLMAVPLTLFCLWARLRIEDTPEFEDAARKADIPAAPIREVLSTHRKALLQSIGLAMAQGGAIFLGLTYIGIYLSTNLGYDPTLVLWMTAGVVLFTVLLMVPAGWLAARFGCRRVLLLGLLGFLVTAYPAMVLMGRQSLALAGVAYLIFMLSSAFVQVPAASLWPRLFERRVRYTGMAIGYNIGTVLAGGTAPYIAAFLVQRTGNLLSPAFFVMLVCVIGIGALLTVREDV
ncbi:MHS family MFS transporter [Streptomyces montanus]|uniref:Putative proline/betaine transporter n=1 Tax=Streptomyces montanus TaxID=2580423 RepID=A0A5R9FYG4_9ACTN|nr:MFS transporter [Streptomyces montanus]TLS47046.1 MHS family MFS transporter [Streptomyces montanus]